MKRLGLLIVSLVLLAGAGLMIVPSFLGQATIEEETPFVVASGSSLTAVASALEEDGLISSADGFLLSARIFGSDAPIQAGEFLLTPGMDQADVLAAFQNGEVILRRVTIPEGMPSVLVWERLMAEDLLTGEIEVPAEGSVLPDTYTFERGQSRASLVAQMQSAMARYLDEAWQARGETIAVSTPEEALVLASIVEKETGTPEERGTIAGLYSNRLRTGMRLQADPTIIYPITQGKPLGRRIRRSEINAVNGYNTYAIDGLPEGPITNPGRESIAAVLNPEAHDYLFMVADGTGGHEFNATNAGHDAARERWYEIRRQRGEM